MQIVCKSKINKKPALLMKNECFISIYLDTRRLLNDGKYPVRLRVYASSPRIQKLYPTPFAYSQRDFESIWNTKKPRSEHKDARLMLAALESKAMELAKKITPFTHEQFERQYNRKASDVNRVAFYYEQRIAELTKSGQLGTASSYELSMKSIAHFANLKKAGKFDRLTFQDVTADWLKEYERYMTETSGKSLTTVGIYLRALRALFNEAKARRDIDPEFYPFGKRRYQIPATKNTKKALSSDHLRRLRDAVPANQEQAKARDFWFFSFACSGMNIKDIALLKWKDIEGDKLTFYRAKTMLTTKGRLTPIVVYLNEFAKQVIERYGKQGGSSSDFVFSIINEKNTPIEQRQKIQSFTRFVNQHIKRLAKANGLPEEVSSYWARHSFATTSIRKGASMELVSESLGHGNIRTTQGYFAGFDSDTKRELAESLMDF